MKADRTVRLRAFTVAELLVYMIISGVVFLSIMSGFTMFRNYSGRRIEKIMSAGEAYDGYHRLAGLLLTMGSISDDGHGTVTLFSGGNTGRLCLADSLLLVEKGGIRDTVLKRAASLRTVPGRNAIPDSVVVEIAVGSDGLLSLAFGITAAKEKLAEKSAEETEKGYVYE